MSPLTVLLGQECATLNWPHSQDREIVIANQTSIDTLGCLADDKTGRQRRVRRKSGEHIARCLAVVLVIRIRIVAEAVSAGVPEKDGDELIRIFGYPGSQQRSVKQTENRVFAPMPNARVVIAMAVKAGIVRNCRSA